MGGHATTLPSLHSRAKHAFLLGYTTYSHVAWEPFGDANSAVWVAEDALPATACPRSPAQDEVTVVIGPFAAAQANIGLVHGAGSGVRFTVAAVNWWEMASASGVIMLRVMSGWLTAAV